MVCFEFENRLHELCPAIQSSEPLDAPRDIGSIVSFVECPLVSVLFGGEGKTFGPSQRSHICPVKVGEDGHRISNLLVGRHLLVGNCARVNIALPEGELAIGKVRGDRFFTEISVLVLE